ncbi:uncharacterized protein EDB91DRAFT_1088323 [Suillus paluster]|uniref:uncharacterized protein n=1 Tax=Suillus paluster TaxID=48578 RepID=UPI001B87F217|nr:uncharacterized protein EDB91DRAFT_1088323 [Suillus paluster]KAG1721856.1 hypothetical protein EDB91DRAFT_1088323 [Suillus paluster]
MVQDVSGLLNQNGTVLNESSSGWCDNHGPNHRELDQKSGSNHGSGPDCGSTNQGELMIFLLHIRVFNGTKSISIKFTGHFIKIMSNKTNSPEIPVLLLALVVMAVMSFCLVPQGLKENVPKKFHYMMADIYEAIQILKQKGSENLANEHRKALALLDLDGMGED